MKIRGMKTLLKIRGIKKLSIIKFSHKFVNWSRFEKEMQIVKNPRVVGQGAQKVSPGRRRNGIAHLHLEADQV